LGRIGPAFAIACLLGLTPLAAHAQVVGPTPTSTEQVQQPAADKSKLKARTEDDWRFGLTVYGWATSLSGNATTRGNTVNFNASIIDIFQKSDSVVAYDSYFEADKGRFGLYADLVWAKLGIPASAAFYANPIAGVKLSTQANAAVTTSLTVIEGGGLYELAKWQGGEQSFTSLDGFVGARLWNISTQVALDITGALDFSDPRLAGFDRTRSINLADSGTQSWVDPLFGLRLRHQFTPSQAVTVRGDIGGFGISGSSQFSWQLAGIYSYTWQFDGYALAAIGGYRALSVNKNFGNSGDNLNLLIQGPVLGLTIKF
jgi:hypothetical protein